MRRARRENARATTYPGTLVENLPCEPVASGGDQARWAAHELVVDDADLHEVLGHGPALDVVTVGLGDAAEEVDRVGVREVEVDHRQDVALGLEDLVVAVAAVGHV